MYKRLKKKNLLKKWKWSCPLEDGNLSKRTDINQTITLTDVQLKAETGAWKSERKSQNIFARNGLMGGKKRAYKGPWTSPARGKSKPLLTLASNWNLAFSWNMTVGKHHISSICDFVTNRNHKYFHILLLSLQVTWNIIYRSYLVPYYLQW